MLTCCIFDFVSNHVVWISKVTICAKNMNLAVLELVHWWIKELDAVGCNMKQLKRPTNFFF